MPPDPLPVQRGKQQAALTQMFRTVDTQQGVRSEDRSDELRLPRSKRGGVATEDLFSGLWRREEMRATELDEVKRERRPVPPRTVIEQHARFPHPPHPRTNPLAR